MSIFDTFVDGLETALNVIFLLFAILTCEFPTDKGKSANFLFNLLINVSIFTSSGSSVISLNHINDPLPYNPEFNFINR